MPCNFSDIIKARYATVRIQHLLPHYREATSIASGCRPGLRAANDDRENNIAVGFGFETYVDASMIKDDNCEMPLHEAFADG